MITTWSASVFSVAFAAIGPQLTAQFNQAYPDAPQEVLDEFDAALAAAQDLASIIEPDEDELVNVSITGVASDGHETTDSVMVSVAQAKET